MLVIAETGAVAIRVLAFAAVLMFAIFVYLGLRRPFVRRSLRVANPEATQAQIEKQLTSNQWRMGLIVWLVVFGIPITVMALIYVANEMSVL